MANLLPQNIKKSVRREYTLRVAIVVSVILSGVFVIAIILLAPTYILLNAKFAGLQVADQPNTTDEGGEVEDYDAKISKIESRLSTIQQNTGDKKISYEIIDHLLERKAFYR